MSDSATLSPDVVDFLTSGTRTGMFGFVAADGRPLVAPVWFLVEHGELVFNTGAGTAKGRAIARDPRVVLTVDLPEPPYGFVQVQGEARTGTDPDEMLRVATALGRRYMGPARAAEFGRRNAVPGELLVTVRPTRVLAQLDMTA